MKTRQRNPPAAKPRTAAKQTPLDNLGIANISVAQARTLTRKGADTAEILTHIHAAVARLNTAATQLLEREDTP